MERAESRRQLRSFTRSWRAAGLSTALVPTMGNLHAGHLALVEAAREAADRVITSIYVNPTQFGEGEDFERYPRTLDADLAGLEAAGCDLAFIPDTPTMYPRGIADACRVLAPPALSSTLEGACRPGPFDGVVSVVDRLFNLVGPDIAVFGEKDYQQLLVIRAMVEDLGHDIRILQIPTVREQGGLAMSSRNRYLNGDERTIALELNRVLAAAAGQIGDGADVRPVEEAAADRLRRAGFEVDYVAVRRAEDLECAEPDDCDLRVLAAVRCGETRLIDNLPARRA